MSDSTATAALVKCKNCGLLAARDRYSRSLMEVEKLARDTGTPPVHPNFAKDWHDTVPICFVMAFPLQEEAAEVARQGNAEIDKTVFLKVVQKDRKCKEFATWNEGCTPRD